MAALFSVASEGAGTLSAPLGLVWEANPTPSEGGQVHCR